MLDPALLRKDPEAVAQKLALRGYELDVEAFQRIDGERKSLQVRTQSLQSERNSRSKAIGKAKQAGEDIEPLKAEVGRIGDELKRIESELDILLERERDLMLALPNIAHESVPVGDTEDENREERKVGEPPRFNFEPRDHVDIGATLGGIDFERASRMAGSRFVVLTGAIARLHRALAQFMVDLHVNEHGYTEVYAPILVNGQTLTGTGQLPKFADDQFAVKDRDAYLIPTAEVSLTNLHGGEILEAHALPLRYGAHTPCFRKEAGSHGRDTRGMLRQHQFDKVELVHLTRPEDSYDALELLTSHAEAVLQRLGLAYRVVTLCTGDIGNAAAKTYDIEVWLPGQNTYREISSCSNCEAFQARRMRTRWRNPQTGKPEPLHTLNGSGVAVGRALIAVLENYQRADGSVAIPVALQPYLGAMTEIAARADVAGQP
ncbi:MAG: serine--tRNA ligase [Gammaproteobacteria bacterium]